VIGVLPVAFGKKTVGRKLTASFPAKA